MPAKAKAAPKKTAPKKAKAKAAPNKAKAKAAPKARADAKTIMATLKRNASAAYKADMVKRYAITSKAEIYGVPVGVLRRLAKEAGLDHVLAEKLWASGVHDARMLATMVDDPAQVTPAQMDRWVKDCDNWALVDTACFHYWDRTAHAFAQIEKWAKSKDEFIKRAAFALLASCALHKRASDAQLLRGLDLIEAHAVDPRNFVKKSANWALRVMGTRGSPPVRAAARELAEQLSVSDDATERWIGRDAVRAFDKAKR